MTCSIFRVLPAVLIITILSANPLLSRDFNQPYSILGTGSYQSNQLATHLSQGSLNAVGWSDRSFSPVNPATYGGLEYTSLKTGVNAQLMETTYRGQVSEGENISLSYLALGFPVSTDNNWGMVAGFTPYSQSSFNFTLPTGDENQINRLSGEGHLNKFYVGSSFAIVEGLTIGANAGFLFGNFSSNDALEFTGGDGFENVRESRETDLSGFVLDGGLQYRYENDDDQFLQLGASAELPLELSGDGRRFSHNFRVDRRGGDNGRSITITDTVSFEEGIDQRVKPPPRFNFGLQGGADDSWSVGGQLSFHLWSDFESFQLSSPITEELTDEYEVSLGGSFTPDIDDRQNFFNRVTYNLGIKYANTKIKEDGHELERIAVSGGFDLPLPGTRSEIHLGVEAGRNLDQEESRINEDYIKFLAAFSLTERWFRERRID